MIAVTPTLSIEESEIDLTVASSEYEIAQLAAGELRAKGRRRTASR